MIVSDSFGRPWRRGTVGIALGAAGLPAVIDWRGQPDLFGRTLEVTETGFADEIAAAASLVQGQAAEATPIVLVRGLTWSAPEAPAAVISTSIRPHFSTTVATPARACTSLLTSATKVMASRPAATLARPSAFWSTSGISR